MAQVALEGLQNNPKRPLGLPTSSILRDTTEPSSETFNGSTPVAAWPRRSRNFDQGTYAAKDVPDDDRGSHTIKGRRQDCCCSSMRRWKPHAPPIIYQFVDS